MRILGDDRWGIWVIWVSPVSAGGIRSLFVAIQSFQAVFTRDAAASSSPGTKLGLSSVAPHHQRPFSSSTGCPDAN